MLLQLVIIFIFLIFFFYLKNITKLNRNKKVLKAKKVITLNKNNLYNWMHLTKKERYNLSKQESINYLDKRKVLLEEIREEYKKISGENSEENLKEK